LLNLILTVQNTIYVLVLIEAIINPKDNWGPLTPIGLIILNVSINNFMSKNPKWLSLVPIILPSINTVLTLEWEFTVYIS
jgi:hypothetical protein